MSEILTAVVFVTTIATVVYMMMVSATARDSWRDAVATK